MKTMNPIEGYLARFPINRCNLLRGGRCRIFADDVDFMSLISWNGRQVVAETSDILSHLDGRGPPLPEQTAAKPPILTGSPVLEGPTVTVAGAGFFSEWLKR